MQKGTRTLADLYITGKAVTIDDGKGPVDVWVQKLSKPDQRIAAKKAGAAKAVVLSAKADEDSELRSQFWAEVQRYDPETLIAFVIREELTKRTLSAQAQIENEEDSEWAKDDYLQGLITAWDDGLEEQFALDPEHVDARRVFDELKRFSELVDAQVTLEERNLRNDWGQLPVEDLHAKVIDVLLEEEADTAWEEEYRYCKVWLGTRHPEDRIRRYFATRAHVELADDQVLDEILAAFAEIEVPVDEGKESPASPASSPPSEQPEDQDQDTSSGLAAVGA